MENRAVPVGWWRSGLVGLGVALPIIWAVAALTGSVDRDLGGLVVFVMYGPMIAIAAALLGVVVVWGLTDRWAERRRLSWVIVAPFVVYVVLAVGAGASGPSGSVNELRLGWVLVVALLYGGAGVAFGRGVSHRVRVFASVVVLAAAPLMIAYDDLSQHRWRKAMFASAPRVLPVVPGYDVVAARADGGTLGVGMKGSAELWVSVWRCRDCTVRRQFDDGQWTVVDGTYQIGIDVVGAANETWPAPDGIRVRPAGLDELAALPLAPVPYSD
ncbi:hypothetical protein [Dactylosporangium sp. NPDC049140]|uniref:hypothetical protein n=1 Tax=Dactylosporangium sp. NPDC049140 TaxID=3155647 RepID=UPI003403FC9C